MKFSGIFSRTGIKTLLLAAVMIIVSGAVLTAAGQEDQGEPPYRIAVFVPGIIADSPIYEMLADGARRAAEEHHNARIHVIEGGTNQGEWQGSISSIAAQGDHDLIVTSNPSMPEIVDEISQHFPEQKFIVMDGYLEGNPSIYTMRYNQYEQAYLAGYFAGLVTQSTMDWASPDAKIGLVAGQEYPDMTQSILPGYRDGANDAAPGTEVDFRVVGNWYDAAKGKELAREMISGGADVIVPISGGANFGVLEAAIDYQAYIVWYDTSGYSHAPGVVIGSTSIGQEQATYQAVTQAIEGTLPFGSADEAGIKEGFIQFVTDDPLFEEHVPEDIRNQLLERIEEFETGR